MKKTKLINLFAGPGAGKSTIASGLYYNLKRVGICCDLPYEFPKQLVWEDSKNIIQDQLFVLANQHRGIVRSFGKTDFIIVDSPILLSLIYKDNYSQDYPSSLYGVKFDDMVIDIHKTYDCINFFLNRPETEYEDDGRYHSFSESKKIDTKIKTMLDELNERYINIDVNDKTVDKIYKLIYNGGY